MTVTTGRCKICHGYYRMREGRLPSHTNIVTGNPCRGRWPAVEASDEDYPVGFDSDPWVMSGGLPERNRSRF